VHPWSPADRPADLGAPPGSGPGVPRHRLGGGRGAAPCRAGDDPESWIQEATRARRHGRDHGRHRRLLEGAVRGAGRRGHPSRPAQRPARQTDPRQEDRYQTTPDLSAFRESRHLGAWAGVAPGNNTSAGKRRSARARPGTAHPVRNSPATAMGRLLCGHATRVFGRKSFWLAGVQIGFRDLGSMKRDSHAATARRPARYGQRLRALRDSRQVACEMARSMHRGGHRARVAPHKGTCNSGASALGCDFAVCAPSRRGDDTSGSRKHT